MKDKVKERIINELLFLKFDRTKVAFIYMVDVIYEYATTDKITFDVYNDVGKRHNVKMITVQRTLYRELRDMNYSTTLKDFINNMLKTIKGEK